MEAIILAGGFGTRLKPLTYTRAKSLLPILNKPMIAYLIESLPSSVDKVVLAVNYRKKQIQKYFLENDFDKEVIVNDEPEPLGTGGAAKFAEKHITDSFFVLNSDIICSLNLKEMIRFHNKKKSISTISLWPVENVSEFGVVDVKDDGNIIGFVEKPKQEDAPSNYINAGAYLLEPEVLDYIESNKFVSMEKEIFSNIIKNTGRFFGFNFDGYWMDIGRISSYLYVNTFLLKEKKLSNFLGDNIVQKGYINNCSLGDDVIIGNKSNIESSILFDNVTIGDNVILNNSIVGEDCKIMDNSYLKNSIVGDHEIIENDSIIHNSIVWNKPIPEGYPKKQIGNVIRE
ncbi:MAG: NDP-sugar synthase [Thermoplasmatales archaeon]|nr:NDP-sugar synthase [Thermoplasmatales archaeon]